MAELKRPGAYVNPQERVADALELIVKLLEELLAGKKSTETTENKNSN